MNVPFASVGATGFEYWSPAVESLPTSCGVDGSLGTGLGVRLGLIINLVDTSISAIHKRTRGVGPGRIHPLWPVNNSSAVQVSAAGPQQALVAPAQSRVSHRRASTR